MAICVFKGAVMMQTGQIALKMLKLFLFWYPQ